MELCHGASGRPIEEEAPLVSKERCVHFVWFRGEEYWSAVKVWGEPDFVHIGWDLRAQRNLGKDDVVIFAKGPHDQVSAAVSWDDTKEKLPD